MLFPHFLFFPKSEPLFYGFLCICNITFFIKKLAISEKKLTFAY